MKLTVAWLGHEEGQNLHPQLPQVAAGDVMLTQTSGRDLRIDSQRRSRSAQPRSGLTRRPSEFLCGSVGRGDSARSALSAGPV